MKETEQEYCPLSMSTETSQPFATSAQCGFGSSLDRTGDRIVATILTVGDELNRGEVVDTNAAFLGAELLKLGVVVRKRLGCNDQIDDIVSALQEATATSELVIVSGGLGPTSDDLTVDAACAWLSVAPIVDSAHEARMRHRFAERNLVLLDNNLRQVRIPNGAEALVNRTGVAPGFVVSLGAKKCFFLPGVPREMKPMFMEQVVPKLGSFLPRQTVVRKVYRTLGLAESHVDRRLSDLLSATENGRHAETVSVSIHYRLAFPEVLVTLLFCGADASEVAQAADVLERELRARLGSSLYGTGDDDLGAVVGTVLRGRNETLATAESCTGGMIGQVLTAVPGSSAYYLGGVIAYANSVKKGVLGVKEETLREHGAVSEACVREMAQGIREKLGATYGMSVSGIAGPDGGTPEKPVGTVWIAVASPKQTKCKRVNWPGDREQVRKIATSAALGLLYRLLRSDEEM